MAAELLSYEGDLRGTLENIRSRLGEDISSPGAIRLLERNTAAMSDDDPSPLRDHCGQLEGAPHRGAVAAWPRSAAFRPKRQRA